MSKQPSSTRGNPLRLRLIAEATGRAAKDNPDSRMQEVSDRANRAARLVEKANREGKAGIVADGKGGFVIVEK